MPLRDALLAEYDQEMETTRKVLSRVPDDKLNFKPHPKSFDMISLATHVATIPGWGADTIAKPDFDVAPPGQPPYQNVVAKSSQNLMEIFEKNAAACRTALQGVSDESLMQPWSLLQGGKPIFTMPRAVVLRSMIMNHLIHHRGVLSVYLRLNDVPVPAMYGPSADEK